MNLKKFSPVINGIEYTISPSKLSVTERMQRRLSFRNERNFYHRKCDFSQKEIISMYSEDKALKVYDQSDWWSDKWNSLDYGKEFDFTRPFFDQFQDLLQEVPRINLINKQHENSEYCNFSAGNKDSYLLYTSGWNEDCFYSNRILHSKSCIDCSSLLKSELCYGCINSNHLYDCDYLQNSSNCNDCCYGYNLKSCSDCYGCVNLRSQKYCILNKQYTKEEYKIELEKMKNDVSFQSQYKQLLDHAPRKYIDGINLENCTGNALSDSKNAQACFESHNLEDCENVISATDLKDCADITNDDHSQLSYEVVGGESNYAAIFCDICWFNSNINYCSLCFHSQNLFGCVGMKKNQYCILNKQYTKEKYEKLVPKIIEHMKTTGEWGEFFPMRISPFAYNETMANDYFPLEKIAAETSHLKWKEEDVQSQYQGQKYIIPEKVADVEEDICSAILQCEVTKKLYKILPKELAFYKAHNINIPRYCPNYRYLERLSQKNPQYLWERNCMTCKVDIQTSYNSSRPEKVLCEECFLKEVY